MKLASAQLAAPFLLVAICNSALADGGRVRSVERQGRYQMTVFTAPTPLRAGRADISVALQDSDTGEMLHDSKITIDLRPPEKSAAPIHALATNESATNKLLKAALIELPLDGVWRVAVSAASNELDGPIETQFEMEVAPPWPAWLSIWPWFTWPAIPIALFVVHRSLVARRSSSRARRAGADSFAT
jgi:hypothetical protein